MQLQNGMFFYHYILTLQVHTDIAVGKFGRKIADELFECV